MTASLREICDTHSAESSWEPAGCVYAALCLGKEGGQLLSLAQPSPKVVKDVGALMQVGGETNACMVAARCSAGVNETF